MKDTILQAKNIQKTYRMGAARINVLKGVDLEITRGQFVAIVGSSGSGKSTLLHILGGLDRPDAGQVIYNGSDLGNKSSRALNRFRNKEVGFVFQFYHLLDELNIAENVYLPKMISSGILGWLGQRASAQNRAKQLIAELGLAEREKHKPWQLSGGERQRAAIGRALMNEPALLLADEPTGNLDSETGNGILRVFDRLHEQGQTIVMVTHDQKIAQRAQRVITLTDGKIEHLR